MLFFLFVVWMAVIIMNLLIGLTITGIEELNREGKKMKILERLSYCKEHVQVNLLDCCNRPANYTMRFSTLDPDKDLPKKSGFMGTFKSSSKKVHTYPIKENKKKINVDGSLILLKIWGKFWTNDS